MTKYLAIDPGKYKCGFVVADLEMKKVEKAIIIKSDMLVEIVKDFRKKESTLKIISLIVLVKEVSFYINSKSPSLCSKVYNDFPFDANINWPLELMARCSNQAFSSTKEVISPSMVNNLTPLLVDRTKSKVLG